MKIDSYRAPLLVAWQLTGECNLACPHCCTSSGPGRAGPGELSRARALGLADQMIEAEVPYVLLCGGEPALAPYFLELAERLGRGGVWLKIETNGQRLMDVNALKRLPIRSVQVSLDGATQAVYARMRPGGFLDAALAACRSVRAAGLPLEVTFVPTRFNMHEAGRVIELALELGAFRFNTGRLMRLGAAAGIWSRLESSLTDYGKFIKLLEARERELKGRMELCFRPFTLREERLSRGPEAPGTLLILPDGKVKVAATLPLVCADLKEVTLLAAWKAYRLAWRSPRVQEGLERAAKDDIRDELLRRRNHEQPKNSDQCEN